MYKKIIALVGRPNVGKSTLFNRLSINRKAIVHDQAGVTRDRKYANAQIGSFEFDVIDTPGLEVAEDGKLENRMMQQTIEAMAEADLICFMVDSKSGILPEDKYFANSIRKYGKKAILIINKCDGSFDFDKEYYQLGFNHFVVISAEHGVGMADLYDAITESLILDQEIEGIYSNDLKNWRVKQGVSVNLREHANAPKFCDANSPKQKSIQEKIKDNSLQIVVSGRPNAGKSTFINSLINNERLLTGPEAGITRESISIDWSYNGNTLKLIDTAGLRKKGSVNAPLEKLSTSDTMHSIRFANTVILMIDALMPLEQQDLNIANYVIDQGRSLIIVVNKWDLIADKDKNKFKEEFVYKLEKSLPQIKGIPVVYISALNKQHINLVLDEALRIYGLWNKKIATSKLNNWLQFVTEAHPLPLQKGGKRVRIKYMTQTKIRPPTFKLFANNPEKITESYSKYLMNNLREAFDLPGVPIRFTFTKTANPYHDK